MYNNKILKNKDLGKMSIQGLMKKSVFYVETVSNHVVGVYLATKSKIRLYSKILRMIVADVGTV